MTKILFALIAFICSFAAAQQVKINPYGGGEIPVEGYSGGTATKIMTVQIQINDTNNQNLAMDRWSLTYRVNGNITNGTKNFPANRIKLKLNTVKYENTNDANIIPTASSLMLNTGLLPLATTTSFFVNNSPYNLNLLTKYYMSLDLSYDAVVDSGSYLAQYSADGSYTARMIVEIRDKNNVIRGSKEVSFTMRIIPIYTNYGMLFDPAAQNISLEFNSSNAYTTGVSKTYTQAFSTVSTTGYTVKVSAQNTNLTSGATTLPVNAIKLTVRDTTTQALKSTVNLSTVKQILIDSATGHTTKFFDTTYSTDAGDTRFMNKPFGQYSGTLVFEMAPK